MQGLKEIDGVLLSDNTGMLVGAKGANGIEYLFPTKQNSASSTTQPVIYDPASVAITGGSVNGTSIGQTTAAAVKTSNLAATYTDSSGTPGNVTNNSPRGRVALAAGTSTIVVTSSIVTAASMIVAMVRATDGAATDIVTTTAAAGSFTITMNAATTGTACVIDFLVVN